VVAAAVGLVLFAVLDRAPGAHAGGALLAVLLLVAAWREFSSGVYLDVSDVRVVGFIRSWRVPWSEVERFEMRRQGNFDVAFVVRSGEHLPVPILAISGRGAPPLVDQLNARLAERRTAQA
jgi:hypothetical protein